MGTYGDNGATPKQKCGSCLTDYPFSVDRFDLLRLREIARMQSVELEKLIENIIHDFLAEGDVRSGELDDRRSFKRRSMDARGVAQFVDEERNYLKYTSFSVANISFGGIRATFDRSKVADLEPFFRSGGCSMYIRQLPSKAPVMIECEPLRIDYDDDHVHISAKFVSAYLDDCQALYQHCANPPG